MNAATKNGALRLLPTPNEIQSLLSLMSESSIEISVVVADLKPRIDDWTTTNWLQITTARQGLSVWFEILDFGQPEGEIGKMSIQPLLPDRLHARDSPFFREYSFLKPEPARNPMVYLAYSHSQSCYDSGEREIIWFSGIAVVYGPNRAFAISEKSDQAGVVEFTANASAVWEFLNRVGSVDVYCS